MNPTPEFRDGDLPSQVESSVGQRTTPGPQLAAPCPCDKLRSAWKKSCFPLHTLNCQCDAESLEITGAVERYYYVQMAIEIARRVAGSRRIEVAIQVLPRIPVADQ